MVTEKLAAFAAALRPGDLPTPVVHQAKRTILNFFGCACGGARHESVEALVRGLGQWSGPRIAAAIGRGEKYDPPLAALVNGMSSAVYSFDDTHAEALIHPGGPSAAAVLALAPTLDGGAFLTAFVIAAEIACRLSKSVSVRPATGAPNWIQTGICAGVGAAAGAAAALGLSPRQIASAMGLAAARASGLRGLSRSMCFSYMAGSAAQAGTTAAVLAQAGMTGPDEALAGPHGFCETFSPSPHLDHLTANLGESYELLANTFKPYPCGVVIHPALDACLAIAPLIPSPFDVDRILVSVHPSTQTLTDKPDPADQYEAQTSLQHWVACALAERAAGVEQSTDEMLRSTTVAQLRQRVRIEPDAELTRSAARVTVELRSGARLSERVDQCRGAAARPLSDEELEAKFMAQAVPALGRGAAESLAQACWRLERLPAADELMQLAAGA